MHSGPAGSRRGAGRSLDGLGIPGSFRDLCYNFYFSLGVGFPAGPRPAWTALQQSPEGWIMTLPIEFDFTVRERPAWHLI